jgi:hypothetical protein
VKESQTALLLFSNGAENVATLPVPGTPAAPSAASLALPFDPDASQPESFRAELSMPERNREAAQALRETARRAPDGTAALRLPLLARPTPVIGATETWNDTWKDPVPMPDPPPAAVTFQAKVKRICDLKAAGGRKGVFWVDTSAPLDAVSDASLDYYVNAFCGAGKGYDRVTGLRGEPWGIDEKKVPQAEAIQDAPSLQDVNVVFLYAQKDAGWAGYFHGVNNGLKALKDVYVHSNERLAFFLNIREVTSNGDGASTIVHEFTHMVNFYQRTLLKEAAYDIWLEEMSAEMTEDVVTPAVTADKAWEVPGGRIEKYIEAGGAVDLTAWGTGATSASSNPYQGVSTLGAFLNRRYGLAIYQKMKDCPASMSGVACVDSLIRAEPGGKGFSDEFARMGATVYGLLPPAGAPGGYGFPATVTTGVTFSLGAADLSKYARPSSAKPLVKGFTATTQTYELSTITAGQPRYERPAVKVPAGTTLVVVIQ